MRVERAATASKNEGDLKHSGFRWLWLANAAGDVGQQFGILAITVTAVQLLQATTLQVSIISALGSMAFLILGMPSGVWVDRWRKRRVLLISDAVRALAISTVPLAYYAHVLSIYQLMVVSAIIGVAAMFFDVAHTSILPSLVGRSHVSEASARLQTVDTVTRVVGPGLAGQALRLATGPLVYAITALMHIVSGICIALMQVDEPSPKSKQHQPFWSSMQVGIHYVATNVVLRTFVCGGALINLGAGLYGAVFAVFVLRDLNISVATLGLITSIGGLGGVAGSLLGMPLKRAVGSIRAVIGCYSLLGVAFGLVPIAGLTSFPIIPLMASSICFSALLVMASISSTGINARVTPNHLMGRVTASRRFITMGAVPLGALIGGATATATSNATALWIAAGLAACSGLVFLLSPLIRLRDLPDDWCVEE